MTFDRFGKRTTPTITATSKNPYGVAVDDAGKIYVSDLDTNLVTTYAPDGTQTSPTIRGLDQPVGIAVH